MEIKFTPWRMTYIKNTEAPSESGCVLCDKGREPGSAENLVLYRGATCYVLMNLYPYNTGHLMVTPYVHTADLPGLDAATASDFFELTRHSVALLGEALA